MNYTSSTTDDRIGFQRIGVTRGAGNFAYWDNEVIMASLNRMNGIANQTVVTPDEPTKDANGFLRDNYLNTGFEYPGIGNGTSFGAGDQWTQVTFDQPIVNSTGPDGFVATSQFLWVTTNYTRLRLSAGANQTVLLPITGGMEGPETDPLEQYTYLTTVATPADLMTFTPSPSGSLIRPSWVAQTFDLSSMGIAAGASVSSLYLQKDSNNEGGFPTFIAGFPQVPEPATVGVVSLALLGLGRRRGR